MTIINPHYEDPSELWVVGFSISTRDPSSIDLHTSRHATFAEGERILRALEYRDWSCNVEVPA